MKKILFILCALFVSVTTYAQTETINWYKDGELYDTTTCESGGDIDLPLITPTKRGYTFQGWSEYLPIEYLESTGTQYIDTGYIPNSFTYMQIQFVITKLSSDLSHGGVPIGGRTGWQNKHFWMGIPINSSTDNRVCIGNTYRSFNFDPLNRLITGIIDIPNNYVELSYEDVKYSDSSMNGKVVYEYPLYLFKGNLAGSVDIEANSHIQIQYVKIKEQDTLVRDFVPVLDSYGVPCMLDRVTETFFYNAGTGDFIAGPIVEE